MDKQLRWLGAVAALLCVSLAHAATIFEITEVLAAPDAPASPPASMTFDVDAAGTYVLTLTDLETPQPFESLQAIVTRDLQVVASVELALSKLSSTAPSSATFAATPGTYGVHVVGEPQAGQAGGAFGVSVTPASGGAALLDTADVIARAQQPTASQTSLQADFTIATAGQYELAISDHAFPTALASRQVLLLRHTDGAPTPVLTDVGTFSAQPGEYTLIIIATAQGMAEAGLFSISIRGPGDVVAYRATKTVGRMPPAVDVTLASGTATLTLTDMAFPAALASVSAALVQNDAVLAKSALGSAQVDGVAAGAAQLFVLAIPTTQSGVGAVAAKLSQGNQARHDAVHIADLAAAANTPAIYSVSSAGALTAGEYRLVLKDFAFPTAFTSLQAAVTQESTVVTRVNVPTETTMLLQAAPVKILIAARVPANTTGLLSVRLAPSGQASPAAVLESTQGVGGLFHSVPVTIASTARYDLTLADLQFPASLSSAALAVTQGTTLVGQIFGSGTLAGHELSPGTYVLNFQGAPASSARYGAYGLRIADSAPAPVLTFTANPTTVASGQLATLQWSATNAMACTSSNGWSGSRPTSGTHSAGPLIADTTFELSCSGPGGTTSAAVTVTIATASTTKRGGGGLVAPALSFALLLLAVVRLAALRLQRH